MTVNKPGNRADVEAAFKKDRDLTDLDYSQLDLSGIRLLGFNGEGLNLSQADLSDSIIAAANLEGADFSDANLARSLIAGVNLEGAIFKGADLSGSRWGGVNVEGADFTATKATEMKASAVSWSSAKVPLDEKPEPLVEVPEWVPGVLFGLVALSIFLFFRRRKGR